MSDTDTYAEPSQVSILNVHLPRRLLILPTTGFALGLFVGMSRGGSRARLRFLAENAHRQPTTVQGWYFYTKTRNYRILFGALKQGSRDALTISAATTLYVLAGEGVSSIRSSLLRPQRERHDARGHHNPANGLDDLQWLDKALAGGMLGSVVSVLNKFPPGLFVRTIALGTIFGTVEGALTIVQRKVESVREAAQVEVEDDSTETVEGELSVQGVRAGSTE